MKKKVLGIARVTTDKKIIVTWIIKPDNCEEKSGVIIPTKAEVFWRLKEADFSYAN
jgi:hypothetical protein